MEIRVAATDSGAVPLTLVQRAVAARSKALSEMDEIDEFWCVFDVEWPKNHPNLIEAITLARNSDVSLAISNPCFELWLILHLRVHGAWLDNDKAEKLRHELDGSTDKGIDPAKYMPHIGKASEQAAKLEERHLENGTVFPQDNPSSGMHRLIASVAASA